MSEGETLLRALAGDDEWTRHATLERLRTEGAPAEIIETLLAALDDGGDATRRNAARMALAALGSPGSPQHGEAQAGLRAALEAGGTDLRVLAASALGETGDPGATAFLLRALEDPELNVVAAAADGLGQLGDPGAVDRLAEKATGGHYWLRAAAVVALGRIRDPRAIPALERAGSEPGLEQPVAEALRRVGTPETLPVLATLHEAAPETALLAAGAVLCAHPELEPAAWIADGARTAEEALLARFEGTDDPAVARLLGLAATPRSRAALFDAVGPPRRSEASLTGILALPEAVRADAILDALPGADTEERVALLAVLPHLHDDRRIDRLVPLLSEADPTVRAAAAEALARAPAERVLPLLSSEIDRQRAPEMVRALGSLGAGACGALLPLLDDRAPDVRRAAAEALGRCATPDVAGTIADALDREPSEPARRALLRALGRAAGEAAVDRLVPWLGDPDPEIRLAAIEGLGATRSPDALPHLRRRLDASPPERMAALRAIGEAEVAAGAGAIEPFLRAEEVELRREAARAALGVARHLSGEAAAAMVADTDPWVRICGARVLARRPGGVERLRDLAASDLDADVRSEARRLVERSD